MEQQPLRLQDDVYVLIHMQDHCGLIPPSAGLIRILCEAERQLRNAMSIRSVNHRISPLQLKTAIQETINACNILEKTVYASQTQCGIKNHHDTLVANIIELLHKSRINNIIRIHNSRLHVINTRQLNNPLTIFSGQRGFSTVYELSKISLINIIIYIMIYTYN